MGLKNLLTPARVFISEGALSRKTALEFISEKLSDEIANVDPLELYERYLARERLGSTAVGHGVAIPHIRCPHTDKPIGILLHLTQGIDFDAPDQQKVDLIFALVVPDTDDQQHLAVLAELAAQFRRSDYRAALRHASNKQNLFMCAIQPPTEYQHA